jgi:lysophospholipid acyltransferase (LPLAT)-like uncharacterized protein
VRGGVSEHRGSHRQIPTREIGSRSDVSANPGLVSAIRGRVSASRGGVSGIRRSVDGFRSNVGGVPRTRNRIREYVRAMRRSAYTIRVFVRGMAHGVDRRPPSRSVRSPVGIALAMAAVWQTSRSVSADSGENHEDSTVYQVRGWRLLAVWLLGLVVRDWCRTLRFEASAADLEAGRHASEPIMILIWHNRLFVAPWVMRVLRTQRPVYALVSASRDGAVLARFFGFVGIDAVRGSSSRLGREALHELIGCQRAGNDMAVTPDGPRGPVYEMKPGALLAARRTRSPLLLYGFSFAKAWRLRSWDRFNVPRPFSRVVFRCEKIDPHTLGHGAEAVAKLRARLLELSGEPAAPVSAMAGEKHASQA